MIAIKNLLVSFGLLLASSTVLAQPWQFKQAVNVTNTMGKGIFHHLESSGRRNIAVSENQVAIAWEDDRDGVPTIYIARKSRSDSGFNSEIKISGNGDAFEPGIAALSEDRFVVVWEENEHVYTRIAGRDSLGAVIKLGDALSAQASVVSHGEQVFVTLSERSRKHGRIMLYQLQVNDNTELTMTQSCAVDAQTVKDDQLYPVVSVLNKRVVVTWEDRRPGHTIIMSGQSRPDRACEFDLPVRISEKSGGRNLPYGAGHGVARVAVANYGRSGLFAAWADKRNFQEGYDIYGASKKGASGFGSNVRIQDDFGGKYRQWHSTVAGHPNGNLVVVWTDEREGNSDIWISWLEDHGWSEDFALEAASGAGEQAHPSIVIDAQGNLHAAWIERESVGSETRVRYLFGQAAGMTDQ